MTKDRLRRYIWLRREEKQLKIRLDTVLNDIAAVSSPDLSGMPHGNEPTRLDSIVIRYEEIADKYEKKLAETQAELLAIERAIGTVDDPKLRLLLRYKYIDGYKWETISDLMHYELRWVYHLHGEALLQIADK